MPPKSAVLQLKTDEKTRSKKTVSLDFFLKLQKINFTNLRKVINPRGRSFNSQEPLHSSKLNRVPNKKPLSITTELSLLQQALFISLIQLGYSRSQ